VAPAERTYQ